MDVVELPYPVDVAAPKLMGSEGFGRGGVVVIEAEARESDGVPVLLSRPGERCSSFVSQKGNIFMSDATSSGYASDLALLDTIPDAELCRSAIHRPDSAQLQQSSTKISKNSSVCSKRQRIIQLEGSMGLAGVDDVKEIEKNHLVKQKNYINNKRGEKRSLKVHAKSKYDTFPVKVGSASFSAGSGGSNFLGVYGLKSDAHDVTKLIDDFSLIGLLDGTYEAPNLGKNTRKKESVASEALVHSVRKAGSVLDLLRPLHHQKFPEIDSSSHQKPPTCFPTNVSSSLDKNQVLLSKPKTPGDVLDSPLHQPKEILELLALPPPKDLDSLLQDAVKPTISSRNTHDIRPGKQIARCPSLPAFPWSYNYSGQSRSNADMIKLSSSKNACIGRWGKIGKLAVDVGVSSDCFLNLDSLKYDDNLVPSERLKLFTSELKIAPYVSGGLHWSELGSPSSATCCKASFHVPLEENCPRILAAAQTLADMATTVKQYRTGLTTCGKKASQKASKTRKSREIEKGQDLSSMSFLGSDNLSFPSKKPKLSTTEKKKDPKGPINWTTPKSFRSSPSKSLRDSIAETRHSSATVMKQTTMMMPPPTRISGKALESNHKMRNFTMEWQNGERDSSTDTIKQSCMVPPVTSVLGKVEKKRKACDNEERPRNSDIDNMMMSWHYGVRDSIAEPRARVLDRDSEQKLTKHSFTNTLMPPPARISGKFEQKRKACHIEERPKKLVMDWRNLGGRERME